MTDTLRPVGRPTYAAPLAACDSVEAAIEDGALRVTGHTAIRGDGPYLSAHFPDITIFPGVFILEAVLQGVGRAIEERGCPPLRLHRVRRLRLLVPLYPGDELRFQASVVPAVPAAHATPVTVDADCRRGDGVRVAAMTVELWWSP